MKKQNLLNLKRMLLSGMVGTTAISSAIGAVTAYAEENYAETELASQEEYEAWKSIKYYCDVYELNPSIIYNTFSHMTEGFTNPDWAVVEHPDGQVYLDYDLASFRIIDDIYNNPEKYGASSAILNYYEDTVSANDLEVTVLTPLTKELIEYPTEYTPKLSIEQLIEKYSNMYGVDKAVALTIYYGKYGVNQDELQEMQNTIIINLAGQNVPNYEFGIICFIKGLKEVYEQNKDQDPNVFLNHTIPATYGLGENWKHIYTNISSDYYFLRSDIKEKMVTEVTIVSEPDENGLITIR